MSLEGLRSGNQEGKRRLKLQKIIYIPPRTDQEITSNHSTIGVTKTKEFKVTSYLDTLEYRHDSHLGLRKLSLIEFTIQDNLLFKNIQCLDSLSRSSRTFLKSHIYNSKCYTSQKFEHKRRSGTGVLRYLYKKTNSCCNRRQARPMYITTLEQQQK